MPNPQLLLVSHIDPRNMHNTNKKTTTVVVVVSRSPSWT